jgi:hypothetical protein
MRVLCAHATVSGRTLAAFVLLGAFIGPMANPVVQHFIAPYGFDSGSPGLRVFGAVLEGIGVELILLAPPASYLWREHLYRRVSVHDAFLLAFAVGFGFDLLNRVVSAVHSVQAPETLTWFPPFQRVQGDLTVAGNGYWTALPVMAATIGLQLRWRPSRVAALAGALVLLMGVERATTMTDVSQSSLSALSALTFHGAATAWVALIALVAVAFVKDGFSALARPGAFFRELPKTRWVRATPAGTAARWHAAVLVLTAIVVILLPMLPAGAWNSFVSLPLLHVAFIGGQLSLLALPPLLLLGWRYLASPPRAFSTDVDEILQFRAERGIAQAALVMFIAATIYGKVHELYVLDGWPPGNELVPFTTVALLITASISTLLVPRAARWSQAPAPMRRTVMIDHVITAVVAVTGSWTTLTFFQPLQNVVHEYGGGVLFTLFGRNGNSGGDTVIGVVMVAFSYGVFVLLLRLRVRIRAFLLTDSLGPNVSGAARAGV